MAAGAQIMSGGFAHPVFDAQATFRAVMDAMARPGSVHALRDHDTPVWLDPSLTVGDAVAAWLGFHTGAPIARTPAEAHFALVRDPASLIALENFAQGSQDYPDRSATLILRVDSLVGGPALTLAGPGIETMSAIAPRPMPRHFVEQWKQNRARFPRGVDVILAAPGAVACLPRTTRITAREG
jgi:alpha-D-ribose 1-methylphosphonate 5-triphosphate synthase subunit PhnH